MRELCQICSVSTFIVVSKSATKALHALSTGCSNLQHINLPLAHRTAANDFGRRAKACPEQTALPRSGSPGLFRFRDVSLSFCVFLFLLFLFFSFVVFINLSFINLAIFYLCLTGTPGIEHQLLEFATHHHSALSGRRSTP